MDVMESVGSSIFGHSVVDLDRRRGEWLAKLPCRVHSRRMIGWTRNRSDGMVEVGGRNVTLSGFQVDPG